MRRRTFLQSGLAFPLIRGLQAQNAAPQNAAPQNATLVDAGFHLHPRYRVPAALGATIEKTQAGLDEFITEKYHDQIAAILAKWGASLADAVGNVLAPGFLGASPQPAESRIVRSGPALEIRRLAFSNQASLGAEAFLRELRASLSALTTLHTAEFQITHIETQPKGGLRTQVRYELTGEGVGFHREQRVGAWDLEWEAAPPDQYRLRRWQTLEETRSRSAKPWFEDIAPDAFAGASSYREQMLRGIDHWRTVLDGASGIDIYGHNGVSVGDIDGDGFEDLYICQPAGLPNRLYRNRGDGTFEDITESSGVGLLDNTACAIFADFSHNGRQDLIVVRASGPLLFLNQGGGKFRLKPNAFQFATAPQGTFTGAAAADYDRDGWLDIYFCLYSYYQGAGQYKYPIPYCAAENGPPNFMLRNNRDGTFRDVTAQTGLNGNNTRYSFCCGWGDFNRDGWPDLYVVNDFGRKNLYRNNGDGTFTDIAREAGVEDVGAGMSVCWFDYDNDGFEDLYVADMWTAAGERISAQEIFQPAAPVETRALYRKHAMGNSLLRNRGDGTFEDSTAPSAAAMGRWSWSSDAWDFDHDGFPDLYIVNGMVSGPIRRGLNSDDLNSFFWRQVVANSPETARPSPEYEDGWNAINELIRADYSWSGYERNVFYANNRNGTFSDVSGAVNLDFPEDGRSFVLADFDHDGRQEALLKNRSAPQLLLLKNVAEELPPSIAFRLHGVKSNPDAIGAVVTLEMASARQTRSLQAGSGFLSQHSKELFFGLGDAKGPVNASIRWPSGLLQQLQGLPINARVWVEEGVETTRIEPFKKFEPRPPASPPPVAAVPASTTETWLLAPVPAPMLAPMPAPNSSIPGGKPALFELAAATVNDDTAAIYNILYRYLFDRHRDLTLPASFLMDAHGDIVKVYQGPVDLRRVEDDKTRIPETTKQRLAMALPFPGNSENYEFGRNNLSLGSAFYQRGYYEQALAYFERALRDDPASAEAHYGIGSACLKQEKNAEARASFEQAVKLTPNYPDTAPNAWNNLGLLATREGRTTEAIEYFQEALRLSPEYWIALENLGNAYRQQRRWDDARAVLERAVAARHRDPEANYSLAMVYAQTDDTGRAYEYLQKALTLRPDYPEALNNLGVLFLRTRRRDDAVAKFEESIRVAPGFDQAYLNLARVYSLEGDRDKARAVLLDLLKQHPGHAQAQKTLEDLR
jgi:tetratricopeptide (TPR) repeat protein